MTLYNTVVDPTVTNSSHTIVAQLVGTDKRTLDVGCATGYLAQALAAQGCVVSGLEYDAEAAEEARPHLERLVVGDLNTMTLADAFAGTAFDAVVFGDVLEHLLDPTSALRDAVGLLTDDGSIVISIPNVAHGSLRLALLQGAWRYRDTGLLDRTHIHFYTLDGLEELLDSAGLVATEIHAVVLDPLAVEVEVDERNLPDGIVDWVRNQPEAYTYQYVLRARPADSPGVEAVREAVPAIEIQHPVDGHVPAGVANRRTVVVNRRNAEIARTVTALRHDALTARDNAIGLEHGAIRAHQIIGETRHDVRVTHERLRAALDEVDRLNGEIERTRRTRTWRVGFALLHPLARLRGQRS